MIKNNRSYDKNIVLIQRKVCAALRLCQVNKCKYAHLFSCKDLFICLNVSQVFQCDPSNYLKFYLFG